jgi:alpha-glucosidase
MDTEMNPGPADAHHDGSEAYLSNPNPELGETVTAFVRIPIASDITDVTARAVHDGEPFKFEASLDRTTDTEAWWRVDLTSHNLITNYRFHLRGAKHNSWLNAAGQHSWEVPDSADFKLTTEHRPPEWVRETVWYQIFPDRFSRRPDGGFETELPAWGTARDWDDPVRPSMDVAMTDLWGGSLNGISSRLDYLEDLGINGIYTCPFFPGRSNHRYDASSFEYVDPFLGGDEALRTLTRQAEARGIRVMGDLTTNHSGNHHDWFLQAQADPASETRSYYTFNDDGSYEFWLGVESLPKFDQRSDALRARLYEGRDSIAGQFLDEKFGLAALRIDVANMTGRLGAIDTNRICSEGIRNTMDEVRPDAWLLAEHGHDATPDLDGGGWHGTMNYAGFTRPVWTWLRREDESVSAFGEPGDLARRSGHEAVTSARAFMSQIPYSVTLSNMNLLGSHDSARWGFVSASREVNEVGMAILCTWPGSPSVFYGDEIGLGLNASYDVTSRQPFPWSSPKRWDNQLLGTYRELVKLRRSNRALAIGGMRWVDVGAEYMIWLRESADQTMLIHVSRSSHSPIELDLTSFGYSGSEHLAGAQQTLTGSKLSCSATGPSWSISELT